jgi:hypothetical protein
MADTIADHIALDAITVTDEIPTKTIASNPSIDSKEQAQMPEPMQVEESNIDDRSKPRTLAIVAALYMVLFIAALDQTIIA